MKSMCPLHSLPHTPVTRSLLFFFTNERPLFRFYTATSPWKRPTRSQPLTTFNICHPLSLPLLFFPWCLCVSFYLVDNERRRSWCSHSHRRSWKKKPFFYSLSNFYLRLSFLRVSVRCCCSLMQQPTSKLKHKKNEKKQKQEGKTSNGKESRHAILAAPSSSKRKEATVFLERNQ